MSGKMAVPEKSLVSLDKNFDPKAPVDLLFVDSMARHKDEFVSLFKDSGISVGNVGTAGVDLYPAEGDEKIIPEGCYHLSDYDFPLSSMVRFFDEKIDENHDLVLFFRKIQYGRAFTSVCTSLEDRPFNRNFDPNRRPHNYAFIGSLYSPFDELFGPDEKYRNVLVPITGDVVGYKQDFRMYTKLFLDFLTDSNSA